MCKLRLDLHADESTLPRVIQIFRWLWLSFSFVAASGVLSAQDPVELTPELARSVVAQEMAAKADREARRKAELEAMPATASRVIQKNDHRVTINRVAAPRLKVIQAREGKHARKSKPVTPDELAALAAAQPEHQSISLSVTVFGEEYSKILWRKPRNEAERREAPEEFEIWTNVNLNYLRLISTFDRDGVVYDAFVFTDTVTRKTEASRRAFARKYGHDYQSRWQQPPVHFTKGRAEYVVTEPEERKIPPELYEQMDTLFTHYLENEAKFKSEHLRNEALRKAKEQYLKENPPQPKDVIINHWPISKGGAQ